MSRNMAGLTLLALSIAPVTHAQTVTCGFPAGYACAIAGSAEGTDSAGHTVTVNNLMAMTTISGRGGECTKTYAGGSMNLTVN